MLQSGEEERTKMTDWSTNRYLNHEDLQELPVIVLLLHQLRTPQAQEAGGFRSSRGRASPQPGLKGEVEYPFELPLDPAGEVSPRREEAPIRDGLLPHRLPVVGGCLANYWAEWQRIGADPWVVMW